MWAFPIIHIIGLWGEWTRLSFWADAKGLGVFIGPASSLGLVSGPARLFFKPHQLPPSTCARCAWARAVSFLVSGVISTCQLGAGLVRALSTSYVW